MNNELGEELCLLQPIDPLPADADTIAQDFRRYLDYHLGRFLGCDTVYLYHALAYVTRDHLMADWRNTWLHYQDPQLRRAHYLSMEYLIGRSLGNNLLNCELAEPMREAMERFSIRLEDVEAKEPDAGLGNGGLGRLAACFLDSCATLGLPVIGYGLRYEYGMFHQHIENGHQVEDPDHWLRDGHPWEIERPEFAQTVHFGGRVEHFTDAQGHEGARWTDTEDVVAVPYDIPIAGYRNKVVNTLRLWNASATSEFNLMEFNAGDYAEAVALKNQAENITMVLYPNDATENGKELRLRQQYFLTSASLQDVLRQWDGRPIEDFAKFNVFQLNDTHPSIAVAELMRLLVDEKRLPWEQAWEISRSCMAYTNHTLLPEALERWPVNLFESLLPRLLEIIYRINAEFLAEVRARWPGDMERVRRMSLIEEGPVRQVRMAWLAIVGSFSINGVAELHSSLLRQGLFRDFYEMWPERFNNKTNGVTPRRWLAHANPHLAGLLTDTLGDGWQADLARLEGLRPLADDAGFRERWCEIRHYNKQRLADLVAHYAGVRFDPSALFDVQVKRIHEYKRQLLNILHIIHLYNCIHSGDEERVPRCVLIGGKAAPGYVRAKEIVKLANNVAAVVNSDPLVGERLKVAFIPNYNVSKMEVICTGTDLSEQISTASKEASGTGNMKFMMNGAVTIGTYDGANIEILQAVGEDNFFLFGLHADEVAALRPQYEPQQYIDADPDLAAVLQLLESGHFNAVEPGIFDGLIGSLKSPHDPWMTLADFRSYIDTQQRVEQAWHDTERWSRMSILNTAASGMFSTDRTIAEYNAEIWRLKAIG
ncbi:glycogen/starch/alpha-glucan phosphorylase [endosymbiont of unidentified scaly snail isolate Monju]|uniref:glycogen/starch/alpha-glucan phosphorylase n=1 Tax=endosymbiont of unidentified scaly snail isolate Monju TaxID=1248727 RepID=UPI0003892726|nr:glycogen/starch/alpha-glucan phosphorylase [endosymbiont of unidentified scaly snail isolate Monju]BAN70087.1 starch phosphorylase [endosymbiont of unidentified scaly snail isolate Monju]